MIDEPTNIIHTQSPGITVLYNSKWFNVLTLSSKILYCFQPIRYHACMNCRSEEPDCVNIQVYFFTRRKLLCVLILQMVIATQYILYSIQYVRIQAGLQIQEDRLQTVEQRLECQGQTVQSVQRGWTVEAVLQRLYIVEAVLSAGLMSSSSCRSFSALWLLVSSSEQPDHLKNSNYSIHSGERSRKLGINLTLFSIPPRRETIAFVTFVSTRSLNK